MGKMYRGFAVAFAGAVGLVGAVFVAVAPAQAALNCAGTSPAKWFYLEDNRTGQELTVKNGATANSTPIVQEPGTPKGLQSQAWTFTKDSNGYCVIRSGVSSDWKSVNIAGGSQSNGAKAILYTFTSGSRNEDWSAITHANGALEFKSLNSGKDLEIPGTDNETAGVQADQWTPTGTANQEWVLRNWP